MKHPSQVARLRWPLALLLLLLVPALALAGPAPRHLDLYAHRGIRGLAPENSMPGYRAALALGVDFVDMDVVMTRDGEVVVYHDLTLNPNYTRGPDGRYVEKGALVVKDLTLEQLRTYDVGVLDPDTPYARVFPDQEALPGTRIPTLREVIRYVKSVAGDRVGFLIELKTDPKPPIQSVPPEVMARAVNQILVEEGVAGRCEVQAFDWRCLLTLHEINPEVATQFLTWTGELEQMDGPDPDLAGMWSAGRLVRDYGRSLPRMIRAMGGRVWGAQDTEMTPEQLEEAHSLGLKVVVWSWPDDPKRPVPPKDDMAMVRRMIDMGVDGIINDRADIVRGLMAVRGLPLPAPCPDPPPAPAGLGAAPIPPLLPFPATGLRP